MEEFFSYSWSQDRNIAFKSEKDLEIFDQLPESTKTAIYKEFLFTDFLQAFGRFFSIEKHNGF